MYRPEKFNTRIIDRGRVNFLSKPILAVLERLLLIVVCACAAHTQLAMADASNKIYPPPFINPIYGSNDRPIKFECFIPSEVKTEMETVNRLAYAVGIATIYPRSRGQSSEYGELEQCVFGWYVSDKFSLASLSWDATHALLKLMSADPEQFFRVINNNKLAGYAVWVRLLEHAQLWGMSDECPNPTPLSQAARSISGFRFPDAEMERMRKEVLGKLKTLKCDVPE